MTSGGWPSMVSLPPNGAADNVTPLTNVGNPTPPAKPMARIRLSTVGDVAKEYRKLYREARAGVISTGEASKLGYLLSALANILATSDLEQRLEKLEGES
jgi:hypothetical protein